MFYTSTLKRLRNEKNLTQSEISKMLEISRGLYSQYEIADKIIPLTHLNKLCNYFQVSIDYIFELSKEKKYINIRDEIDREQTCRRLKEFRKENKLTQEKLAKLLNTSHSVISSYEKNNTLISTGYLYTICKKYNISADYLLGKIDNPKKL